MANQVRFTASVDDKVSGSLAKIRDNFDLLGKGAASSTAVGVIGAKALGVGLGLVTEAAGAVVGGISDSIKAASDLNETLQKSQVVFGSAAGEIKKFGEGAAVSMGMSENAAISAAASIGNLLLSTGTAKDKIAPMSEGIVKLAADLASFNNIPMDEALAKLQSGLVGQERPLRELGVAISAASVDTEAARLGFTKLNGVFTEGEKVQARYSLIFKQTATAQGDFARTSDQLANSQRIVNAELEDASAKIGGQLTPGVTKLEQFLAKDFIPTALSVVDVIANAWGTTGDVLQRGFFDPVDIGIAGTIKTIGSLNDTVGGIPVPWHKAADTIGTGLASAGKATDDFARATDTMAGKVTDDLGRVASGETKVATSARVALHDATIYWQNYRDAISKVADQLITNAFQPLIDIDTLAAKNAEIYAQDVIIAESRKTIASKDSSKAQIKAARDASAAARVSLHQLDMDQATMLKSMAKAGTTTSAAYKDGIAQLKDNIKNSSGPTKTALEGVLKEILILEAAAARLNVKLGPAFKLSGTHPGGGGPQAGNAAGGPVSAGDVSWVGEQGPELVQFGANAFITPADLSRRAVAGSGGGGLHLHVHTIWPPTPLQVKAMADALDKHEHYAANGAAASGNRS